MACLEEEMNPSQVAKKLNISKQKLQYYLSMLKRDGFIQKIGYGVWKIIKPFDKKEVKKATHITSTNVVVSKSKDVRGHGFMFRLKLPVIGAWDKRREWLDHKKVDYKRLKNLGGGESFVFRGRKVVVKSSSILVFDKSSYISTLATDSRSLAVYEFRKLVESLERLFGVSFLVGGKYKFRVSREHYALMENALARQYDTEGNKLMVFNADGLWLLIDNSFNLHELEAVKAGSAVSDSEGVQQFFNELKSLDWEFQPKAVMSMIGELTKNMVYYGENVVSHVGLMKKISDSIERMDKRDERIVKALESLNKGSENR